jgi:hypothetical protein
MMEQYGQNPIKSKRISWGNLKSRTLLRTKSISTTKEYYNKICYFILKAVHIVLDA